jgi:transposase InsO family protein
MAMPWEVSGVMEQRYRCVELWRDDGESVTELASRFGVTRKTIYKWIERYELGGMEGLADRSKRPLVQVARTAAEIEDCVIDLRRRHPTWGPEKLKRWLERHVPERSWPARSTIGLILKRAELSGRRTRRRHATPSTEPLAHATAPNHVWAIDFKGWFVCGNGERCDPLTVSDAATRYLLCCQAVKTTDTSAVQAELTRVFRLYGLPVRMRSDNGSPFASTGVGGMTKLSAWWIKLGIVPERIEPGEPQQNGRHERMHRTLKQDTARPPAASVKQQQQRFDEFVHIYNDQRPHEALGGDTPADHYEKSPREFPEKLDEVPYPAGMQLRRADEDGKIRWKQVRCRVGHALAHEVVGVEVIDDGLARVWFGPLPLGLLDERKGHSRGSSKGTSHWPTLQSPSGLLARRLAARHDGDKSEKV